MARIVCRFVQSIQFVVICGTGLFGHGPRCQVMGGPEMLREMRATVQKMVEMYGEEGYSHGCKVGR